MTAPRFYLGDGVYCALNDRGLVLTTENGLEVTNTIVLESVILEALLNWLELHKVLTWEPHK